MFRKVNKLLALAILVSFVFLLIPANTIPASAAGQYEILLWYDNSAHYQSNEDDFTQLIKEQLEDTGYFKVTTDSCDWSTCYTAQIGTMPMFMLGWFYDYFDETNYIEPFVSTAGGISQGTNYSNPVMDQMILDALATSNPAVKSDLLQDIQSLMVYDPAVIPLTTRAPHFIAYQTNMLGVYLEPRDLFRYAPIEKLGSPSYIVGTTGSIGTSSSAIDFSGCYSFDCSVPLQQMSHGLFELNNVTAATEPFLAQSWSLTPNGLTYEFSLDTAMTFVDGSNLRPEDAMWSLNRSKSLTAADPYFLLSGINTMAKINSTSFNVTLSNPDSTFIKKLTYTNAYIFKENATVYGTGPNNLEAFGGNDYLPVGLGPYYIASQSDFVLGDEITFTKYAGYNAGGIPPVSDTVILKFFSDSTALTTAMKSRTIDVGYHNFDTDDVIDLENDNTINTQSDPAFSIRYIVINVDAHPNRIVRQALTYAFDRQAFVDRIFGGVNSPLYQMPPPAFPDACDFGDTNGTLPCAYPGQNLTMVAQLMESQGYTSAFVTSGPSTNTITNTQQTTDTTTVTVSPGFELAVIVTVGFTSTIFTLYQRKRKR